VKKRRIVFAIAAIIIIAAAGLGVFWQKVQALRVESVVPETENAGKAKAGLTQSPAPVELGVNLLFSPELIDASMIYEVKPGDSLFVIAKKFGTTIDLIKASNNIEGEIIKPGQKLKIITGKFKIVVNVSTNTLSLFLDDKLIKAYPVGTAKYKKTPLGKFKIVNRIVNPTWYAPDGVYPFGDPKNIIGTRWMGIDKPGYGIHGTSEPESIGKYVSQGCIRMYNRDVEELFSIVAVGTEVDIIEKQAIN